MITVLAYIGLCFAIALIGHNRKFGFWGYLFCSLAFTPCIGLIVLLGSDKRPKKLKQCPKCAAPLTETNTPEQTPQTPAPSPRQEETAAPCICK
jgi:hypothetical protein